MEKEYNLGKIKKLTSEVETLKEEKDVIDGKLARLLKSSKDLENIIKSQRSEKVKEGVGYNAVPPPTADLYLSLKKDLSWTGLPEFVDDTVSPPVNGALSVNSGPLLEFHQTLMMGMRLCFNRLTSRSIISIGSSTKRSFSSMCTSSIEIASGSSDKHFFRVGDLGKSGGGNSNILDIDDIAARRRRLAGKDASETFHSTADLGMKSGLGSHLSKHDARLHKNLNVGSMLNEASVVNTTTRVGECDDSNLVVAFTGNGTRNLNKSTAFSTEVTDRIFSVSNCVTTKVTGSKLGPPFVCRLCLRVEWYANEATGMRLFNSKSSNTSHTSIATGFFTSNNGVSKGSSGFASHANGGATRVNDTPFASKLADVKIRESSRSLLEEVSDGKYNALFDGLSDMHGSGQNYDGVDMELTKSILEEISSGKYDELVAGMSTADLKTYSEVIQILVEKFADPNKPIGAHIPCSESNINEAYDYCEKVVGNNASSNVQTTFNKATPVSFAGAASSSFSEPKRGKASFRSLVFENACEGVELSVPMNVVETVSNWLENTLYGYFIGKRVAFPIVEYFVQNTWAKYSPLKEEFTRILVWVKLSDVPLHVFFKDGISLIATQIGSITMGIPLLDGLGFSKEMVRVEYEWKPHRCDHCMIFGHVDDQCLKNATNIPTIDMTNDGFQVVVNKRKSGKTCSTTNHSGVNVGKSVWHPINPKVIFESKNHEKSPKNGILNMSTSA
nr:hypothetical protein [Tanacetum cinerariifolium]